MPKTPPLPSLLSGPPLLLPVVQCQNCGEDTFPEDPMDNDMCECCNDLYQGHLAEGFYRG